MGGHSLEGHSLEGHSLEGHSLGGHSLGRHSLGGHSLEGHSLGGHSLGGHSLGGQCFSTFFTRGHFRMDSFHSCLPFQIISHFNFSKKGFLALFPCHVKINSQKDFKSKTA